MRQSRCAPQRGVNRAGGRWIRPARSAIFAALIVASRNEFSPDGCRIWDKETRKKMDNAWLGDIDGDGDLDAVTTEENGGWGVIWFENPLKDRDQRVNLPLSKSKAYRAKLDCETTKANK